jgi:hypothetical protein
MDKYEELEQEFIAWRGNDTGWTAADAFRWFTEHEKETCEWKYHYATKTCPGYFATACDHGFGFMHGKFCCFCGRRIVEVAK